MQQGDIELAIKGRPPEGWPTRAEPFAMHPHVLVTAIDHRFTRMEAVPASALSGEGFIVREPRSGTRAALDEYTRAHQMTPQVVMQMSSNEAIKQAVMAGMGISPFVAAHVGTRTRSPPDSLAGDGGPPHHVPLARSQ